MIDEVSKEINTEDGMPSSDSGLTRDNIARMLEILGEDVINDMLGSTKENGSEDSMVNTNPKEMPTALQVQPSGKKHILKGRLARRFFFVCLFIGILLIAFIINQIYMMVSINSHNPIQYSEMQDEITCSDGILRVNNVSVSVPSDGKEKYSISYSWSAEDTDYPSIPHAINAIYKSKKGSDLYSLSLYRNETVPKSDIPSDKTADNWFDDWKSESDAAVEERPLKSNNINGYYIAPSQKKEGSGSSEDYNNYSYYFSVADERGINIYVLEGICLNEEANIDLTKVMTKCIQTITVNKPGDTPS